jgi:hypothetical protein
MRAVVIGMIAVLTLAALAVPRSEAQAQDYLTELGTALGGWAAPYADFAEKGEELVDDVAVIFNPDWMAVWQGDLASFDSVASAIGAVTLPSDADAALAALIAEIAGDVPDQTAAVQTGMDDITVNSGASLTAGYIALSGSDLKVTEAIALVEASGGTVAPGDTGTVAPSDTGNAGLAAAAGSSSAATFGVLALFAFALVGGARLVVVRLDPSSRS